MTSGHKKMIRLLKTQKILLQKTQKIKSHLRTNKNETIKVFYVSNKTTCQCHIHVSTSF